VTNAKPAGAVAEVFRGYPKQVRKVALALRQMIYEVAENEGVGRITETLKWGEPAYLSKLGSTIRIGWRSAYPNECALFFICHTTLVSDFRSLFDGVLRFEGDRAILLRLDEPLPKEPLKICIGLALRYRTRKR
jgi:hypothetical protein